MPRLASRRWVCAEPGPGEPLFPLRDENPTLHTPFVTVALVMANVVVWLYLQGAGMSEPRLAATVCRFGVIPAELTGQLEGVEGIQLGPGLPPCTFEAHAWETLFSYMFLHGSWLHLIANMWFLWLFGNNVEDSMGHGRYLVFFVLTGLVAAGAHIYSDPAAAIPMVGASGAVSGLMGAYLVLYPKVRIQTLFIIIFIIRIVPLPAWLTLIVWFLIQLASGYFSPGQVGVAFWAHIGGFVAGVVLVKIFENRGLVAERRRKARASRI
jgi:membrane associated rhomboid family serine protease